MLKSEGQDKYTTKMPGCQACRKCGRSIPADAVLCCYCGKPVTDPERKAKQRGNGTGTVFRIGSGWAAEVTLGYYMDGGKLRRRSRRKQGFKSKKDAVNYLQELRQQKQKRSRATFSELYAMFTDSAELSKSKKCAYRIAWKKIKDVIAHRYIDELTVPELQVMTDEAGSSYYTKRDIKTLLSHCYKLAIRDDLTDKNRAQYIQLPPLETSEREIMTEQEIQALWADWKAQPSEIAAQMLTMLYTGIRPGELLTIVKQNVNLPEHYMTGGIKTTKGKNRKIIIPEKLSPVLAWMMLRSKRDNIAYYPDENIFYNAWKDKRQELGIRDVITPYCCRHTYVTRLTALKVSPAMLQELCGHEDYETTLDYTHLSVAERFMEVNKLA